MTVATTLALGLGLAGGAAFANELPIPGLSELSKLQEGQPGKSEPGKSETSVQQSGDERTSTKDDQQQDTTSQSSDGQQEQGDSEPTTRPASGGESIGD
ncbi:hypothetical protein [Saccharopolyspora erythraea]|uniref:hypothetical protein n=1 Tax=Saccharopolyspora erythraea TaxID=1836 RepID=UPI0001D30D51|nr:hypothetical protein [Saccharopolyspora erythraea]EQD86226.1 hypothetical protein N599_10850 [Saccharopolyspora erythraea D]QRK87588.1 hypothetical protein JQX30_22700 [Saccharopolyspora erythraea]